MKTLKPSNNILFYQKLITPYEFLILFYFIFVREKMIGDDTKMEK